MPTTRPLNNIMRFTVILMAVAFMWFIVLPDLAFADFNLEEGANNLLKLVKTILLIAMIVAALVLFMRHQLMAALVVVVVGAVVLAAASPDTLESLGTSVLNLIGGGGK